MSPYKLSAHSFDLLIKINTMSKYLPLLIIVLLLKAGVIFCFVQSETIGLAPDEAQYWTWSQHLDWGYYSKPPGIAWQIKLGTLLFGNTEQGVRCMANLIGFLLPLAVYGLAKACELEKRICFWAAIVMAFSPLGILSSILATTDGGMVLFWTISCLLFVRILNLSHQYYLLLGLTLLCGALFKWPIFLLWPFFFAFSLSQNTLSKPKLWGAFALSSLALLPSLWWNFSHHWATFRHVFSTIQGGHKSAEIGMHGAKGNLLEFLGAQAALLSPLLFGLLLFAGWRCVKQRQQLTRPLFFCAMTTFILLFGYAGASFFQKIQGNWCVFLYPTAIVILCWGTDKVADNLLKGGILLSVLITTFVLSLPWLQSHELFSLPYRMNPFRHNLGWKELDGALDQIGYNPQEHFLFADKYQMTSLLSFYASQQKPAYFLNLLGTRRNQFSYWPGMWEKERNKTGFFVFTENSPHFERTLEEKTAFYEQELRKYFEKVEGPHLAPLLSNQGSTLKSAVVYRCINYNGSRPEDPDKF